ncbi:hypothetical protein JCM14469_16930 [Desulfatiferula olefinivorans]
MTVKRDRFDFDIGHITKSPCLTCPSRFKFPKCLDRCEILDELRTILARGVSSSYSSCDP